MRFLATNLIFQEVKPDVFANNRNSLALDTGLSLKDIQKPEDKISGTGQAAAWCLQYGDMVMEMSLHLPDIVLQPNQKHSDSAFNHWAKTDALFFDWLNFPENRERLLQFNFGMGSQNRGCEGTGIFLRLSFLCIYAQIGISDRSFRKTDSIGIPFPLSLPLWMSVEVKGLPYSL